MMDTWRTKYAPIPMIELKGQCSPVLEGGCAYYEKFKLRVKKIKYPLRFKFWSENYNFFTGGLVPMNENEIKLLNNCIN